MIAEPCGAAGACGTGARAAIGYGAVTSDAARQQQLRQCFQRLIMAPSWALNQAELLRDEDQLQRAVGAQFLLDRRLVIGRGLGTQAQTLADFFDDVSLRQNT